MTGSFTWYNILQARCVGTHSIIFFFLKAEQFSIVCMYHTTPVRTHGEPQGQNTWRSWEFSTKLQEPACLYLLWGAFFQELSYNLKNELTSQAVSHWIRNGTKTLWTWETPPSKAVWGMKFFIPLCMVKSCPISVGNMYSKWTNIKMGTWLGLTPVPHWSKKQLELERLLGWRKGPC